MCNITKGESAPEYWSLRKLYLHWSSPSSDCQCSSWQTQQAAHLFPISAASSCTETVMLSLQNKPKTIRSHVVFPVALMWPVYMKFVVNSITITQLMVACRHDKTVWSTEFLISFFSSSFNKGFSTTHLSLFPHLWACSRPMHLLYFWHQINISEADLSLVTVVDWYF